MKVNTCNRPKIRTQWTCWTCFILCWFLTAHTKQTGTPYPNFFYFYLFDSGLEIIDYLLYIQNNQVSATTTWYCRCYIHEVDIFGWICLYGTWKGGKLCMVTREAKRVVRFWEVSNEGFGYGPWTDVDECCGSRVSKLNSFVVSVPYFKKC